MGNEMSAEAVDQAQNAELDIHNLEPAASNAVLQVSLLLARTIDPFRSRKNLPKEERMI